MGLGVTGAALAASAEDEPSPGVVRPEPAAMHAGSELAAAPTREGDRITATEIAARIEEQLVAGVARPHIDLSIQFGFNSAELTDAGRRDLDEAGVAINRHFGDRRFVLAGHTDSLGSEDYNLSLSQDRADAARRYLIEQHEIPPERLEAVGYGESQPIPGEPDVRNRRVSLELLR